MITEIKYRPGSTEQKWTCEPVEMDPPRRAHVRYTSDVPYEIEGVDLPVGMVTDAVYWNDRNYHVWRFTGPDGTVLGYRFDICSNTFIWPEKIIWTDLGIDLWVPADLSTHVWQDVDDMSMLVLMEHLSPEEGQVPGKARAELERTWRDVIREAFGA